MELEQALEELEMYGVEEKLKWGRVAFIMIFMFLKDEDLKEVEALNLDKDNKDKEEYEDLIDKAGYNLRDIKYKLFCIDVLSAYEKVAEFDIKLKTHYFHNSFKKRCEEAVYIEKYFGYLNQVVPNFIGGYDRELKELDVNHRVSFAHTQLAYNIAEKYYKNMDLLPEETNEKILLLRKLYLSSVLSPQDAIDYIYRMAFITQFDYCETEEIKFAQSVIDRDHIQAKLKGISYEEAVKEREEQEDLKHKLRLEKRLFHADVDRELYTSVECTKLFFAKKYGLMQEYKSYLMATLEKEHFHYFGKEFEFLENGSRPYTKDEVLEVQTYMYQMLIKLDTYFEENIESGTKMPYLLNTYAGKLTGYDPASLTKGLYDLYRKNNLLNDPTTRASLPYKIALLYSVNEFIQNNETVENADELFKFNFDDKVVNIIKNEVGEK